MRTGSEFYTPIELAAMLGRHPRTIQAAIKRGEIPAVKIGRRYVCLRQVIDRWLLTGRTDVAA